jgi:hypothetical protein
VQTASGSFIFDIHWRVKLKGVKVSMLNLGKLVVMREAHFGIERLRNCYKFFTEIILGAKA